MTIYLYVKTHNITGLKYLGKTTKKNPYSYPGSGTYWKRHLSKHGDDCATEILKECQTDLEIKQWGKYYSDLWNVVASNEWANLKPESGNGGPWFGNIRIPLPEELMRRVSTRRANDRYGQTKGKSWWNDGVNETMAVDSPGINWHRGRNPAMSSKLKEISSVGSQAANVARWGTKT